ncbi:MAG: hypothetical protein IPO83_06810 [Chitinophagaceae bacterium]|nr:hypothetical protein [Chitinophagaceae bacterium]
MAASAKKNFRKQKLQEQPPSVSKVLPEFAPTDDITIGKFVIPSKPVYWFSLVAMSLFLLMGAFRMGVPADTPIDYAYGKATLSYFKTFGADTSYAALKVNETSFPDQKYYGALFEMLAPAINVVIRPANPFITHHILCALAGIVLLLFTGLIAKQLKGWSSGLLALWLIFLTPVVSGNAFFNSKDIPFAAAFAAGFYYLLLFLETLPAVRRTTLLAIALSVAAAVSIRISGILLPAYLGFFTLGWYFFSADKKERPELLKKCFVPLLVVLSAGTLAALLTYPNFWHEGLAHITEGLATTKKFQHNISMLYDNKIWSSQKIDTDSYLLHLIYMTVPEVMMIGFVISAAILLSRKHHFKKAFNWMLFYAAVFPVAYVMLVHAPIYNGWRHVLFAYPFVVVITSLGLTQALMLIRKPVFKYLMAGLLTISMIDLLVWQVRAFPYNYVYYNHLSGGLSGIYKHYDTDYQQLATHDGVKWLLDNELVGDKRITVLSNNANALQLEYDSAKVKFEYVSIKDMWAVDWDYAVISTVFLNEKAIDAMFPPFGTIHTIERFNVPLSFIVKRESRDEIQIYRMMKADSLAAASDLIEKAFNTNKTNTMSWYWKACTLYLQSDYKGSLKLLADYNQLFPEQDYIYELTGYNYYSMGNYSEAIKFLNVVYKKNPSLRVYNKMIGDCLVGLGHPDQAKFYYDKLR